jgi:exoribonuclease-2
VNKLSQVEDPDHHRRRDLRALPVYTIDSSSTVEIDDGLSIEYRGPEQKEWALIHIADPTRWMSPNNDLDLCARKRASTLYLPELVQSMLPLEIARDVMSLLPSHRSHALTFAVRLGEDGGIEEYEIFPSLLQNIKRTNYDEVNTVLEGSALTDPALHRLYELALKRRAWRRRSGAYLTNFPKAEAKVVDGGQHVEVMFECQSDSKAQIVVSEMMILTGQVSAQYAQEHNIPVAYRTQAPPFVESEEYDAFLRTLPPIVREFEYIGVMNRATGSATPGRHFGVGFNAYARASSPIRRYSDILVHYQIKAHLRGDPLPFSFEDMQTVLAGIAEREEEIFHLQRDSRRFWVCARFDFT